MEAYLRPEIFIPIILSAVLAGLYYFYRKMGMKYPRKKRGEPEAGAKPGKEPIKVYEPVYAQVFDNTLVVSQWYWETIPGNEVARIIADHKTLGIQQDTDDGKKAYQLVKNVNDEGVGSYRPVTYPILKDDNPVELNYDTEHPEYEIILAKLLSQEKNFMQKYGQVLWWAAVIGFIIFMMVSG